MPETQFSDLTVIAQPRNGQAAETTERAPSPRPLRGAKGTSLEPGRIVDPTLYKFGTDPFQMSGAYGAHNKKPHGRDETTAAALRTIRDWDPQASQAVSNFLRLINPGHDLRAYQFKDPATPVALHKEDVFDTGSEIAENGPAQAYLDSLTMRVGSEYGGGLDNLHNVLSLSLITNGAVSAEVAPTDDLTDVDDWYPVDPSLIHFRRDPVSLRLVLGQLYRDGSFHTLNTEQVFYTPLDPDVNDPYGRPPLLAAISVVMQRAALINDIRAVAHAQGFPRLNISVKVEELIKAMPPILNESGRERERKDWMEGILDNIVGSYDNLEVDDVFVHFDWVDIAIIGPVHSNSGFDFKGIEQVLSKNLNSALKMLPILLGINEATSETHGSIQWQIQIESVKALRRLIKRTIEKLANVSLALKGFQAHARIEYKETRTTDRLFEEQANFFQSRTVQLHEQMGWRSHDEAAEKITGHKAAADPQLLIPVPQPNTGTNTGGNTSGQEGNKTVTGPKPDAGPDQPKAKATGYLGSPAAWQLISEEPPLIDWRVAPQPEVRQTVQQLDRTYINTIVETYVEQAARIFAAAERDLLAQMSIEGYDLSASRLAIVTERDQSKDIADYVFGIGFSREMKAMLRDAFRQGMVIAGTDTRSEPDEKTINRIWQSNRQFISKIRDELKESLRNGEFTSLSDIHKWFETREWRELLMGKFLAKQGLEAGHSYAISQENGPNSTFIWQTSASAEHCLDCSARDGEIYTYDELTSIGFPASGSLDCAANCKCSLIPE